MCSQRVSDNTDPVLMIGCTQVIEIQPKFLLQNNLPTPLFIKGNFNQVIQPYSKVSLWRREGGESVGEATVEIAATLMEDASELSSSTVEISPFISRNMDLKTVRTHQLQLLSPKLVTCYLSGRQHVIRNHAAHVEQCLKDYESHNESPPAPPSAAVPTESTSIADLNAYNKEAAAIYSKEVAKNVKPSWFGDAEDKDSEQSVDTTESKLLAFDATIVKTSEYKNTSQTTVNFNTSKLITYRVDNYSKYPACIWSGLRFDPTVVPETGSKARLSGLMKRKGEPRDNKDDPFNPVFKHAGDEESPLHELKHRESIDLNDLNGLLPLDDVVRDLDDWVIELSLNKDATRTIGERENGLSLRLRPAEVKTLLTQGHHYMRAIVVPDSMLGDSPSEFVHVVVKLVGPTLVMELHDPKDHTGTAVDWKDLKSQDFKEVKQTCRNMIASNHEYEELFTRWNWQDSLPKPHVNLTQVYGLEVEGLCITAYANDTGEQCLAAQESFRFVLAGIAASQSTTHSFVKTKLTIDALQLDNQKELAKFPTVVKALAQNGRSMVVLRVCCSGYTWSVC